MLNPRIQHDALSDVLVEKPQKGSAGDHALPVVRIGNLLFVPREGSYFASGNAVTENLWTAR